MSGWVPWNDDHEQLLGDDCRRPSDFTVDGPRDPTWSGLYGATGEKLYRLHPPIGFGHHDWKPYS